MFSSTYKYFIILLFFIILCFIGLVFSLDSVGSFDFPENGTISSDIDFSSSTLTWPTPRL